MYIEIKIKDRLHADTVIDVTKFETLGNDLIITSGTYDFQLKHYIKISTIERMTVINNTDEENDEYDDDERAKWGILS